MNVSVDEVVDVVARHYFLAKEEITSQEKRWFFSHPRQMAMFLAREFTEASTTRIGQRLGGKDHTTVLNACRTLPQRAKRDPEIAMDLAALRATLNERKRLKGYDAAYDMAWQTWAFVHRRADYERTVVDGVMVRP